MIDRLGRGSPIRHEHAQHALGPTACATRNATSAESMPPDRPKQRANEPGLPKLVANEADHYPRATSGSMASSGGSSKQGPAPAPAALRRPLSSGRPQHPHRRSSVSLSSVGRSSFGRVAFGAVAGSVGEASTPRWWAFLVAQAVGPESNVCACSCRIGLPRPSRSIMPARRRPARLCQRSGRHQPIVDGYFGRDGELGAGGEAASDAAPLRRRQTSWPEPGCASSTTVQSSGIGLVAGTGNKTESLIGYSTLFGDSACAFNPIGDLYKKPGDARLRRRSACPNRSSARRRRPISGRVRRTKPRPGSATRSWIRLLFWNDRQAPQPMRSWRAMGFPAPAVGR